jgi:hypothetical protein
MTKVDKVADQSRKSRSGKSKKSKKSKVVLKKSPPKVELDSQSRCEKSILSGKVDEKVDLDSGKVGGKVDHASGNA